MRKKADEKLAQQWRTTVRTIARWRAAGAPLQAPARMRAWLASRKNLPTGTLALLAEQRRKSTSQDLTEDAVLVGGAAQALHNLEKMEARTFRALEQAMARGDATEIKNMRENWLRVSAELRK